MTKFNIQNSSMSEQLLLIEKNQLAIIYENGKIRDLIMEHKIYNRNDIYAGKIASILPSLDAAFIKLNKFAKNGFIHLGQLKPVRKENYSSKYNLLEDKKNIIVQIKKEPTGTKGPSLTTDLHISGRYINIFPVGNKSFVEKNQYSEKEKNYLKAVGNLLKPLNNGILIKTQIMDTSMDFILKEISILKLRWKKIITKLKRVRFPGLLSKKKSFLVKVLEYAYRPTLNFIGIDSKFGATKVRNILGRFYKKNRLLIENYINNRLLIRQYCIDLLLNHFLTPRININKGAYIIIEKTEALTVIDVNSGSFIKSSNSRSTSFWTNYSATKEIVNQIKLRNIGGIIIIDFIDSSNQEDQMKILYNLSRLLKEDKVKSTIVQMSELGLVEITRSRQGQSIYDAFSTKCLICNGIGYITQPLANKLLTYYELGTQLIPSFSDSINI